MKFFVLKSLSATEVHEKILSSSKESASLYPTVRRWVLKFERGRTSVKDEPRSGRPKTASRPEIIQGIHDIV